MADSGLPRSFLRPMLLVSLAGGSSHGYELAERLWQFGLVGVDLAGVYRTLRIMEHEDLVVSRWEPSELGPPRRVYTLSPAGVAALGQQVTWLREARGFLDRVLDAVASG